MANEAVELAPCPFCGGKAETGFEDFHDGGHVKCTECGVSGPVWANDTGEAIAAWNRRALTASQVKPGETLERETAELIEQMVAGTAPMSAWMASVDYSTYDEFEKYLETQLRAKLTLKARLAPKLTLKARLAPKRDGKEKLADFVDGGTAALEGALATYRVVRSRLAALLPAKAAEPVAWQKNADETARLITKALAERTPVLGGPEGETILAYSIPSGLWLMLQAEVRLLLDKLYATPPSSPVMVVGEGFDGEDLRLLRNIRWSSADKDNMEFTTRASCYQVEALNRLLAAASPAQAKEGKDG